VGTTLDGTVVEINDTLLGWLGHDREDVVGRRLIDLLDPGSRLFFETRHTQVLHLRGAVDEVALTMLRADGTPLPMLVNSAHDVEAALIRTAVFNASERTRYERSLLQARREAEASSERVRVLQEISSRFDLSVTDEDVATSLAEVSRSAFAARETTVLLVDERGVLGFAGGSDPLEGALVAAPELLRPDGTSIITTDGVQDDFPDLASAMRSARLAAVSVTPLVADDERLGVLVCHFARRTQFDEQFADLHRALVRQASQTLVRVRLQRRLAFLALHDQLTGVANRRLLQRVLDEAIEAATLRGEPLSLLFLDVDDFKGINDAFGHAVGDSVLVELAARLRRSVRSGDVVGRIGGDEFVAICADADGDAASAVAARILEISQEPIRTAGTMIQASVSVGISLYRPGPDAPPTAEQLLVRADGAMYESKRAGKRRATFDAIG
jgi:diguanylate cyclase (GGDEF)-like protein/PAS domain S-box-containing protein